MAANSKKRRPEGVTARHARSCASRHADGCAKRDGGACDCGARECNCGPAGWEPWISKKGRKHYGPVFARQDEAKAWRHDALAAMGKGTVPAPRRKTIDETADELLTGMEAGTVRGRGGRPYKPSAIASYRTSLALHVRPTLGSVRLADLTPVGAQALVDRLVADGLSGQTVRYAITALSVVYRYARRKGYVTTNPTRDLELPEGASARTRIVDPNEAHALLEPLPISLRALYALAIYAGLRRGEIAGLGWSHIKFDEDTIVVERSWCWRAKAFQPPKTEAGTRRVPMFGPLAAILLD